MLFPKVCDISSCFHFSGNTPETRGTAFVVYEDIFDAKNACDHLSGFNVCNRYLVVLYYQVSEVLYLQFLLWLIFTAKSLLVHFLV